MAKRTFKIYRYDPDKDAKPYMQSIELELDGSERMLLDVLVKLHEGAENVNFLVHSTMERFRSSAGPLAANSVIKDTIHRYFEKLRAQVAAEEKTQSQIKVLARRLKARAAGFGIVVEF